ncbi:MAG: hypothetical protein HYS86_03160 [Candidatus Chisholmbacteria bacterium]|nr:hypothetical protein [Candidatus Chisholmbacteria bacterium]
MDGPRPTPDQFPPLSPAPSPEFDAATPYEMEGLPEGFEVRQGEVGLIYVRSATGIVKTVAAGGEAAILATAESMLRGEELYRQTGERYGL